MVRRDQKMKTIILALLLLPTLAIAQTSPLPCPGTVTLTYDQGYTVTLTCSPGGPVTPPVVPPPVVTPPPPPVAGLPAGAVGVGGDSSRMQMTAAGTLYFGSASAGWTARAVNAGDIVYCQRDNFPGAPSVSFPSCYFLKAS